MQRVLLVCTANLCRSPMAESIGRFLAMNRGLEQQFQFASAGLSVPWPGSPADARAREALVRAGYPPATSRARQLQAEDFRRHDRILGMDRRHMNRLQSLCPDVERHKLGLFLDLTASMRGQDVPDPYYTSGEGFDRVLALCEAGIEALLAEVPTRRANSRSSE